MNPRCSLLDPEDVPLVESEAPYSLGGRIVNEPLDRPAPDPRADQAGRGGGGGLEKEAEADLEDADDLDDEDDDDEPDA